MPLINGFQVRATAVEVEPGKYRPALVLSDSAGEQVSMLDVGYQDFAEMIEADAHEVAQAVLADVVRISDDGRAVFVAQGAIQVRLIWPT